MLQPWPSRSDFWTQKTRLPHALRGHRWSRPCAGKSGENQMRRTSPGSSPGPWMLTWPWVPPRHSDRGSGPPRPELRRKSAIDGFGTLVEPSSRWSAQHAAVGRLPYLRPSNGKSLAECERRCRNFICPCFSQRRARGMCWGRPPVMERVIASCGQESIFASLTGALCTVRVSTCSS